MFKKLLFAAMLLGLCSAAQAQGTLLWEETFDNGTTLPNGWSQTSSATDGGWKIGTPASLSSGSFNIGSHQGNVIGTNDDGCNCNKANEILELPPVDMSTLTSVYLLFDAYFYDATYQGNTESLVLQVSVDQGATWSNLKTIAGSGSWQNKVNVNLAAYVGMADVRFRFRYDDGNGWLYGAALDNIQLVEPDDILRSRLASAGVGKNIETMPRVVTGYSSLLVGDNVVVRGAVENTGFPVITSFDVTVTRGTETWMESFSGLNLELGQSEGYEFSIPVLAGANDFNVEVSNINGGNDNDPSDNTRSTSITGVEAAPGRKVVAEEGTGPWCGWCPRGAVMMDYLADNYADNMITIAVHNGSTNPMKVVAYDSGLGLTSFPGGKVDRVSTLDPIEFEQAAIPRMAEDPKVLISQNVSWDETTRVVNVTSALNFQEDLNGLYRIAVVFTEDGINNSASTYGQVNYYSGGGNGPMGGYENLPSTVPASQMIYNHVAREIVGGFKGAANSVPFSNPTGSVMFYESSYTVPATYNIDNMHAITLLINQVGGQIVNAEATAIPFVSTAAPTLDLKKISVSLAPNPVVDEAMLTINVEETSDVQVRIVDAFGRIVTERVYNNISGKQFLPFRAGNLANGMYTVVATSKGQSVSKPFVIAR